MIKLLSPSSPAPSNLSARNKGSWLVVIRPLIVVCSALLLAIWPLPETIALRHVLLGVGFIASLAMLQPDKRAIFNVAAWPLWVFLGFYLWLLGLSLKDI